MAEPIPRGLAPAAAIRWFAAKGLKATWDWRALWQEEHAIAFTAARTLGFDVLSDLFAAIDVALREGLTVRDFVKGLRPVLVAKGWWGERTLPDPKTGEPTRVTLGTPSRLEVILDTNLRMAWAKGHWESIVASADRRPWLYYSAVMDHRTRPEHARMNGTLLPASDPWWLTHYPPNGFRCRCQAIPLADADLARRGLTETPAPAFQWVTTVDRRTGRVSTDPDDVDPGFGYNVGQVDRQGQADARLKAAREAARTRATRG